MTSDRQLNQYFHTQFYGKCLVDEPRSFNSLFWHSISSSPPVVEGALIGAQVGGVVALQLGVQISNFRFPNSKSVITVLLYIQHSYIKCQVHTYVHTMYVATRCPDWTGLRTGQSGPLVSTIFDILVFISFITSAAFQPEARRWKLVTSIMEMIESKERQPCSTFESHLNSFITIRILQFALCISTYASSL